MHNGSRQVVPACIDCNCAILRDHPANTPHDRAAVVATKLDARLYHMPDGRGTWRDDEILSVKGMLRSQVKADRVERARLEERIRHAIWRSKPPEWDSL